MEYRGIAKLLAFFLFISSVVTSYCLFMLAGVYATGDLPFGIKPVEKEIADQKEDEKKKAEEEEKAKHTVTDKTVNQAIREGSGSMNRINERIIRELYKEMQTREAKIAEEREEVAEERRHAETITEQALKMQAELETTRNKIKTLLDIIDEKEIDNIKRVSRLIEGLEIERAAEMFLTYDNDKAARLLYYMNPKTANLLITQILVASPDDQMKRNIKEITERMHRLTEELDK